MYQNGNGYQGGNGQYGNGSQRQFTGINANVRTNGVKRDDQKQLTRHTYSFEPAEAIKIAQYLLEKAQQGRVTKLVFSIGDQGAAYSERTQRYYTKRGVYVDVVNVKSGAPNNQQGQYQQGNYPRGGYQQQPPQNGYGQPQPQRQYVPRQEAPRQLPPQRSPQNNGGGAQYAANQAERIAQSMQQQQPQEQPPEFGGNDEIPL